MRRVVFFVVVAAGFFLAASLWTGCSSLDFDNTANGGERISFGFGTCRPYAYEKKTELTPTSPHVGEEDARFTR